MGKTLPKILICVLFVVLALGLIYIVSMDTSAGSNSTNTPFLELNNNIKVNTEKY